MIPEGDHFFLGACFCGMKQTAKQSYFLRWLETRGL